MEKWELLRDKLETTLGIKAWYQPASDVYIDYPAVVFHLNKHITQHADNRVYLAGKQYSISVISPEPEPEYLDKLVENFPSIRFDRPYTADNLYHYVYTLYF